MQQFLQQTINGLSIGGVYALIALGYTMVYGIIKLINFAHGEIFMFGAYVGMIAVMNFNIPIYLAFVIAMAVTALFGVIIERVAYKPLRKSSRTAALITAIGVSFLIQNGVLMVMGANIYAFPQVIPNRFFTVFGLRLNMLQLVIFATSIALMIILQFIVSKTKLGRAMRSVAVDKDAAALMGVNVDNVITITFAIGSALAAAAGIMVGLYYIKVFPFMGFTPGLKAFVAAVFGGIGIIPGAMIGGFAIGLIETYVAGYGSTLYKDAVVFIILILILLVKPSGLLGKNVKEKV
ncbi:MAG: branched-chain amino acid ABC transporter permease [Firmicutes bacterium HGW-Firmicutes-10]|jgi:branched-chain amino acid transport system permease protein|nr:branched-chain amino acid ABC transporter permease [Erysipelotrichaceae bacterium]PKM90463.1 MAG: branched-chain amino acid ABC transporter permease [Firmicutes bacterium HGW-Firmicutes-10]